LILKDYFKKVVHMNSKKRIIKILAISMLIISASLLSVACIMPAEGEGTTAETGEATTTAAGSQSWMIWIWLAVIVVAFYFLLIWPQRKKNKESQQLLSGLQRGEEIVTIGGFHGRIKDVRDDVVIITIASGVDVKISKSAIARKITQQQENR
jgi:preprotein translocase subunit YajC